MDTLGIQKCPHFMSFVDADVFLATETIRCVFSCHLRMPYFAGGTLGIIRGPVRGCHGKSRYLTSNIWIFNRK